MYNTCGRIGLANLPIPSCMAKEMWGTKFLAIRNGPGQISGHEKFPTYLHAPDGNLLMEVINQLCCSNSVAIPVIENFW